jgi:hypothetical protein
MPPTLNFLKDFSKKIAFNTLLISIVHWKKTTTLHSPKNQRLLESVEVRVTLLEHNNNKQQAAVS